MNLLQICEKKSIFFYRLWRSSAIYFLLCISFLQAQIFASGNALIYERNNEELETKDVQHQAALNFSITANTTFDSYGLANNHQIIKSKSLETVNDFKSIWVKSTGKFCNSNCKERLKSCLCHFRFG